MHGPTRGAANNWPGMAVDEKRGIVYVPTGSAASDFYGADRSGDDLFANCLIALKADTGERVWHFQAVKHDLWDRDFPSPPNLVTVKHNGKLVDAIAQTTKQGWVYLFDRTNGQPLFPIEERAYPASDVPGETGVANSALAGKTGALCQAVTDRRHVVEPDAGGASMGGRKIPDVSEPGPIPAFERGQGNGGVSGIRWRRGVGRRGVRSRNEDSLRQCQRCGVDGSLAENRGGNSGRQTYLTNCGTCHGESLAGAPPQIPALTGLNGKRTAQQIVAIVRQGAGRMPSFPNLSQADSLAVAQYVLSGEDKELAQPDASPVNQAYRFTGYHKFLDPDGYPAVAPPWGTLNAINLNTGEYAWKIPLGEYPELAAKGLKATGSENYGGPIVTAGGLVFIAATNFDRKFRGFDKSTGKLLWETTLPFAGNATPITYEIGGRQYVVIYATGGKSGRGGPSGGTYVAFALPAR